ncbi:FAD-binding oxidoreductase [Kordiimonas aestuarii]|uniref:FAD-binding oxidoreductase n=1 Tax=Kordiimonas aestuarii TaxID=1005925 RepID=UPI0021CE46F9|nr:FAD-binding oxidoreductase [Kordiimonas aestuarii]
MTQNTHMENLRQIAGPDGSTSEADILTPHLTEWRDKFHGSTPLMLMPADVETASRLIAYCQEYNIKLVPQGGNTGLVGGSTPGLEGRTEVLFSTKRLNKHCVVDADNFSITADAGCTIAELQTQAAAHDLLFPLSLASEGSCTVGGVISTNAGGIHVLRYGTTRALTLGLQAVLPNGDILDELTALRKNNTGYNLSQLLVGAEGTLGLVTRATFKLYPREVQKHTCLLAVDSPQKALKLLASARIASGDRVSAFELMPRFGIELVLKHIPGTSDPLGGSHPWYVLTDIANSRGDAALEHDISAWLETSIEDGVIADGSVAASLSQAADFWRLRESMSEAQKIEGGSIKHDIAVPVSRVPVFLAKASDAVLELIPNARLVAFGHLGDGNIHFNLMQPQGTDKLQFLARWEEVATLVHDIVTGFGGSISAEHGIGTLKKRELSRLKSDASLAAMRSIKNALDPNTIMNPGVLFNE